MTQDMKTNQSNTPTTTRRHILLPAAVAVAFIVATGPLLFAAPSAKKAAKPNRAAVEKAGVEPAEAAESAALREARELVKQELTRTQNAKLLALLNEGAPEELADVKGLGATRIRAIEAARPLDSVEALVDVRGIGKSTFAGVLAHGKTLTRPSTSSAGDDRSRTTRQKGDVSEESDAKAGASATEKAVPEKAAKRRKSSGGSPNKGAKTSKVA